MKNIHAVQINNGLGAGNIGDDLMARAFWDEMPANVVLEVAVLRETARVRAPYPARHLYMPVDWSGNENAGTRDLPGLLVGDTPVTSAEGLHWPMQFLTPRLQHFHDMGQPVDAVGVGVDTGLSDDARELFHRHFLPIRSWTVRSQQCREALLSYGVPEPRIRVGADWAWLYRSDNRLAENRLAENRLDDWAQAWWRQHGVEPEAGLIVVNIVNLQWKDRVDVKRALAAALDWASLQLGMQVAFFCNECRSGEFQDYAASLEVSAFMSRPAVILPNEYYTPDEAIALLRCATLAIGSRYHFLVEAVLAGCVPVGMLRAEKLRTLAGELRIPIAGEMETLQTEGIVRAIQQAVQQRAEILSALDKARDDLALRALQNLSFVRHLPPYATAMWSLPPISLWENA
jgi:polysaccharide pyruvyl transferase WcaK-like protein